MKHQDALAQLARETARARNALALERAVRGGFWLALAVSVWAALALAVMGWLLRAPEETRT